MHLHRAMLSELTSQRVFGPQGEGLHGEVADTLVSVLVFRVKAGLAEERIIVRLSTTGTRL